MGQLAHWRFDGSRGLDILRMRIRFFGCVPKVGFLALRCLSFWDSNFPGVLIDIQADSCWSMGNLLSTKGMNFSRKYL